MIPNKKYSKFEEDILPMLAKDRDLCGYHFDNDWYDIDTPEAYRRVQKDW